ncbi:unnamed protein product [Withania somnifera]
MGFIIIGISSLTDTGLNATLLQIISHGIRLVYLDEMGGIAIPMPKMFTMFSSFSMASLALPGMSGFVVELIVFFGIITGQKYLLIPKLLITFVMAIGIILTSIYSLSMSCRMFYGYKLFNARKEFFFILDRESIGIYPDFIHSLAVDKVKVILSNFFIDNLDD